VVSKRRGKSGAMFLGIGIGVAMSLTGAFTARGEGLSQQSVGVTIDYVLTIADPASGQAATKMTIKNISTPFFEVEEHAYQNFYINILSLYAYDSLGRRLSITYVPNSGSTYWRRKADVWRIACEGLSQIVVEYAVKPGLIDPLHGHRSYIAPDFAVLAGEHVFLVPRNASIQSVSVAFELPDGWDSYTPWMRQGEVYDPSAPGVDVIENLSSSSFALGQFDVYTHTIGSTQVAVAAYHGLASAARLKLPKRAWQILDYQTAVFGQSVGAYYLAIFCPPAPDGYDIYASEWSNSQGYSIRVYQNGTFQGKWDMFAHQVFHRWNGFAWGIRGYYPWFSEGPNVLYEMKTLTELRIDGPYGDMAHQLRVYYDTYLSDYVAQGKDQALASLDLDNFLVYRKGAMVAFLMAKEIFLRTGGEHNFTDFLRVLFDKYGYYAAPCSEECLKAELASLTGTDFTQFFHDYVYGTTTLPMEWAFMDSDGDGLANALEIGWNTHPERPDSDGDGYSDAMEVQKESDPLDPLSIPNVNGLPILIDGEKLDWQPFRPVASDLQGDTTGGPHTDLKGVFSEKDQKYLYFMVEPYDPPLLYGATIELNADLVYTDLRVRRFHFNIHAYSSLLAWVDSDHNGEWEEYPISGALMAWSEVMELRLPLGSLGQPSEVRVTFVNLWCDVGGQRRWVDMIVP